MLPYLPNADACTEEHMHTSFLNTTGQQPDSLDLKIKRAHKGNTSIVKYSRLKQDIA